MPEGASANRLGLLIVIICAACLLMQRLSEVATAQENRPDAPAGALAGAVAAKNLGAADGALSLGLTGERRPFYRLRKSDVLEVNFTFSPEFNQTATVQPDGFLILKGVGPLYAEGQTVTDVQQSIVRAYRDWLHDPEVTVTLRDFDKPYFIASGEVTRPGKYELRADITVTEAVAIAGGFTRDAKHSQIVLFRRVSDELAETRLLDLKKLLKSKNLKEDVHLRSGDLVFIPQNTMSKIRKYLPFPTTGMYVNPTQF